MNKLIFIAMVYFSNVYASNDKVCINPDERLLHCPQPASPRVAELEEGKVTLEFRIEKNGSTSNIKVIKSSGDERWIEPAIKSLTAWKYLPLQKTITKEQEFEFVFTKE